MVARTKAASKKPLTLGAQIDKIFEMKFELKKLQEAADQQDTLVKEEEEILAEMMKEQGVDKSSGKRGSVGVGESKLASVKDWDAFWAYIFKTKQTHLLEKRPSQAAVRELFELNKPVPGVEQFTKRKLTFTSTKKD